MSHKRDPYKLLSFGISFSKRSRGSVVTQTTTLNTRVNEHANEIVSGSKFQKRKRNRSENEAQSEWLRLCFCNCLVTN